MAPKQRGVHVSLRNMTPAVPANDEERTMLKEDLLSLGCAGLMDRPWNLKNEEFVQQFVLIQEGKLQRNNMFDTTIRDRPEDWTASIWREVYDFLPRGCGMANRTDLYIEGKFRTEADPKDGFPVKDCRDDRERRLLEFLVPIVHPDKPTRVTRTIGNTVFGALSGDRPVDWGKVFSELVQRLVGGAGRAKPTPICPFLFHLYECKGLLTEEEETDYTTANELNRYEIPPERDEDSDSGVLHITGPEPTRAPAPVNQVKRGKRNKKDRQAPEGSQPVRSRGEGSRPVSRPESPRPAIPRPASPRPVSPRPLSTNPERSQPDQSQPEVGPALERPEEGEKPWVRRPFDLVRESYRVVKTQYQAMESFIEEVSTYLDVDPADVLNRIKDLPKPEDLTDLQARMDCLLKENVDLRAKAEECDALRAENAGLKARAEEGDALRSEIKELKDRLREAEKEAKAARMERDRSKEVAQRVSKFLGSPGDVLNKARLFDHDLKQPATDSGVKIMRYMIDHSQKMEKTLKELRSILKPVEGQPEPTGTPGAGPSTTPAASFVTPPVCRPDPLLQEPIPVLNTDEMANLRDWAARRLEAVTTPTGTGQNPGTLSTPGSVSQEHQRREEERTKRRADVE